MTGFFLFLRAQRRALLAALAVAIAFGAWLTSRMPAAILPEVTFPRVKVIAESGERPGEEMLRAVTRPLEESLRRVPDLHEMRSITSRGSAEINLDCSWGTDMDRALQRVQAQVDAVRGRLPEGTSVEAQLMSPVLFPVYGFSLTSPTRSLAELRDLAVMRLQPELSRLPGVSQVMVQGGDRLEARVTLDPVELEGRGLDAATIAEAVGRATALQSVGLLDANRQLYLGIADARPPNLDALAAVPIPVAGGPPVALGRLGRIELAPGAAVHALRGARAGRGAGEPAAPAVGQHARPVERGAALVPRAPRPAAARREGGDVLRPGRPGAGLGGQHARQPAGGRHHGDRGGDALPAPPAPRPGRRPRAAGQHRPHPARALAGAPVAQPDDARRHRGAVGLVLDDGIVVVEHLEHELRAGGSRREVARSMAGILPTLVGSSLCTIAIFIPFMFLGGVAGAFFRVLALAMALDARQLAAGVHRAAAALRRAPARGRRGPGHRAGASRTPPAPGRLLRYATRHAWVAIVPPVLLLAAIPVLKAGVGSGFLPEMDEGALILDYVTPPGTSVTETDRMLRQVEAGFDSVPEIAAWSRRTGDQLGFFITEPNMGDHVLRLKARRRRSGEEIADGLRARIAATQPMIEVEFGQLIEDVIGDLTTSPQPIEVRIYGEDRRLVEARARDAADLIAKVRGVVDVKSGVVVSGPNLTVVPGPLAQRAGLGAAELARATEPYLQGLEAGQIQRGARSWPVRVVLPLDPSGTGPTALRDARVPVPGGRWVRLGDVATLSVEPGETEIVRDDQRTMVDVTARLSGRDLGSAVAEIQRALRRGLPLGPGMSLRYAGQWAEQQSSFKGLGGVLLGATAAVLLVLLLAFRSWRRSAMVILVAAASLAGAFVALRLGGATFNVASFVGAIMVVGIVAENAFFLVAEHQRGLAAGASPAEAAAAAAQAPHPARADDHRRRGRRALAARLRHGRRARRCCARSPSPWSAGSWSPPPCSSSSCPRCSRAAGRSRPHRRRPPTHFSPPPR